MAFFDKEKNSSKIRGLTRRITGSYKRAFSVDFEQPLSLKDQLIIMTTILFISVALFAFVYLGALAVSCSKEADGQQTAAGLISEESVDESFNGSSSEASFGDQTSDTSTVSEGSVGSQMSENSHDPEGSEVSSENSKAPPYYSSMKKISQNEDMLHYGCLVLVDKNLPSRYDGENVVPVIEQTTEKFAVTDFNVSLDKEVVPYVNQMLEDFYSLYGGTDIMIACGYRSYSTQVRLYNEEIESQGEENAENWVAPPGFSEHQTGFAFDLNLNIPEQGEIRYEGTGIYSWINENCQDYGFIIRYPAGKENITGYEYEPWHFRYVGAAAARYITQNGMTLEEYLDVVHTSTPEKPLVLSESEGIYTYFVKAASSGKTYVSVPSEYLYDISGNNYDGFIVTVYGIKNEAQNEGSGEPSAENSEA